MNALFNGSFLGVSEGRSSAYEADCVLALEFSHRPDHAGIGQPNIDIALRLDGDPILGELDLFAGRSITRALMHIGSPISPLEEFKGWSARGVKENLGTYGELLQAKQLLAEYGYMRPAILHNRYNIGNVVFQALKTGLDPIVPPDQPGSFDPESDQIWTRNLALWRLFSYPRLIVLRAKGH